MKMFFSKISACLLGLTFCCHGLWAHETPILLCSDHDLHGRSMTTVVVSKIWHSQEPGMEPPTSYKIQTHFIGFGINSHGVRNPTRSNVSVEAFLSKEKLSAAKIGEDFLVLTEKHLDIKEHFNFTMEKTSNEASLSHRSGTGSSFDYNVELKCMGSLEN